jgi:hypothetical protein
MRRMDIRIALLLGIVLLIASPVALTTDVPRDSATTVTRDASYAYEDARGTTSAKGDLNHDAAGEYSKDVDVSGDSMTPSLDTLSILQTTSTGCRIVVDEYTVDVDDTIPIPIRVEGGVDVGSLDLNITFDPTRLSVKSALDGAFDCTVINPEADRGVVKVIAYQGVNPGLNGNFTVAEIVFEALRVGDSPLDLEIVTLTDATSQVNHLNHSISNGTVAIVATVTIPDVSATGMITVPITIENVSNVGSCQLTLSYDPDVVIVSSASKSDFDSMFANLEDAAYGSVSILAYQTSNPGLDGAVIVAEVTFMTVGNSGSSTPLDLEVTTLTDATPDCNPIPYTSRRNGSFTVFLNGDVNGDSRVDVADCMYLAKYLLGVSGFETIIEDAADVNGNGEVEASDCMFLAKHLAGMDGFEVLK